MPCKDKARRRELALAWYHRNADSARKTSRLWKVRNRDRVRELDRKYKTEHPDRVLNSKRKHRQLHIGENRFRDTQYNFYGTSKVGNYERRAIFVDRLTKLLMRGLIDNHRAGAIFSKIQQFDFSDMPFIFSIPLTTQGRKHAVHRQKQRTTPERKRHQH